MSIRQAQAAPLLLGAGRVQVRSGLEAAERRCSAKRAEFAWAPRHAEEALQHTSSLGQKRWSLCRPAPPKPPALAPSSPSPPLSGSSAALPSTANPAFLCPQWHLPLPKVARLCSCCNKVIRSVASRYPWGNAWLLLESCSHFRGTGTEPAVGEAKMIHLQARLLFY